MKTESADDLSHQSGLAVQQLKRLKRELEILYKDLIRITFNSTPVGDSDDTGIPKVAIIPLESKINSLIFQINDQLEEIEDS
jgi:hypothetical protein